MSENKDTSVSRKSWYQTRNMLIILYPAMMSNQDVASPDWFKVPVRLSTAPDMVTERGARIPHIT
jgi:hypothetical protein